MEVRHARRAGRRPLLGAGVYYGAALTEAATYRDKDVFVVGGANSAGQGAMFFSRHARKVTMLVRGPDLSAGMSQYLVDRIAETTNIEVLANTAWSRRARRRAARSVDGRRRRHRRNGASCRRRRCSSSSARRRARRCAPASLSATRRDSSSPAATCMADGQSPAGGRRPAIRSCSRRACRGLRAGDARHGSGKRVAAAVGEGSATVSMIHQYLKTV